MTRALATTVDVLVVDDNPIMRDALRGILAADDRIRVVGEAANGREALTLARDLRPAVTLLDHRMPIADGLSVVAALGQLSAVLVLTSSDDPQTIGDMLHRGARGYLVHGEFQPGDLLRAVHEVVNGRGWLSPIAASVAVSLAREQTTPRRQRPDAGLTERELQVVNLLCQGLSNAGIAQELWLTEKTVKNHLNHIFAKLGVRSRTEAIVRWTSERA
ncbi:DNA-binding response regulator, NarL/FixJ family, contains REC and HTH domains [Asanoa hainanensis]|uniref:DNA-binding response regulator, NarL/FixJ family, contains REC and HTH domains n=1 Tax=Asanoa hainanensis TaxID=560556 RepID=A0A239IW66_9ACTN|nr:response regulator transcription factor [Asanoa hainanensis]SNS98006.1 DNA-binding response regulator, NarL/FixJ family, contains REC and HTH domains [Asanoa hainanensis]